MGSPDALRSGLFFSRFVMGRFSVGFRRRPFLLPPHEDAVEKDNGMTKQLDAPQLERLARIKEDILALLLEAVSLVHGTPEEQRANHWYASVCTALDKDNTQGNDSTITMQESIDALRADADA